MFNNKRKYKMSALAKLKSRKSVKEEVEVIDEQALVDALDQITALVEQNETIVAALEEQEIKAKALEDEVEEMKRRKAEGSEDEDEEEVKAARKSFKTAMKSHSGEIIKDGKLKVKSAAGTAFGAGGDTIVAEVAKFITERVMKQSALVAHFGQETAGGRDYSKKIAKGGTVASWEGEYSSTVPVLVDVKATSGTLTSSPMVDKNVAADSFFDAYSWLQNDALKRIAAQSALALLSGDGVKKPKGLTKRFDLVEGAKPVEERDVEIFATTQLEDIAKVEDALRKLVLSVPADYHGNARWGMSQDAYERIHAVKDGMGRGLLQMDPTNPLNMKMFGFDVVIDVTLKDTDPVMFGDFDAGIKVVNLPNTLDVVSNIYRIPGNMVYDITMRSSIIAGTNDAIAGLVLPVAAAA
ncbi:phage major capsid protein [Aeromonas piscicola]|uniref:phage major capsid protein n=1 Tax=Aeromonas piscicola TaxID=600645 RepID=UPI0023EA7801|nr:phage major capsid protein [Aeromonas piscicola]